MSRTPAEAEDKPAVLLYAASVPADPAKRNVICLLGGLVLPFVLTSVYLFVSRYFLGLMGNMGDHVVLLMSLATGVACVWISRLSRVARVTLTVPYLCFLCFTLPQFVLLFLGYCFGHWL